ncbi:MAG: PSD1 and planctomycete cytochrome C domain-containing protein [Armatimonadota bacterium]
MRPHPLLLSLVPAALLAGAAFALAAEAPAPSPAPSAEQARFFESRIRPVLVSRCGACHGAKEQKGGLRVDSRAALLKGGARGPAVLPGEPDGGTLLAALTHADGVPKMPPTGKLSDRELADLRRWIETGAPWPETRKPSGGEADGTHWSFRPIRRPAVPRVKNQAWVRNPIDAFVLAELERRGLSPAPEADRRTLIRRVTFDLTGLPPTPAEVQQFLTDRSPDAYETLVERLLASPRHGERWGRHWLDVARYADSNGMDENVHYGNAWRYRDYVVRSFNQDKPFDQFIREQLAGDLLPASEQPARHEQLIATGFLSIGPKLISEVDSQKVEMDIIDEQIDTVGRAFMGLTLGCARCHDHKFDPISAKDYYALAGIFKSTQTIDAWNKPRMWFEHSIATEADLARKAEHERKVAAQKKTIAEVGARETELWKQANPGAELPKQPETAFRAEGQAELKRLREELAALEKAAPEMPACMGVRDQKVVDVPVHLRGDFLTLGEMVPRRFPAVLAGTDQPPLPETRSGRLELAQWIASPENPLTARVAVNRAWRWHFGQGLVRSTDNFGILGEKPSHPALLDYLAWAFSSPAREGGTERQRDGESRTRNAGSAPREAGVRNRSVPLSLRPSVANGPSVSPSSPGGMGWSVKRLHRLIVLSSTYRMSSRHDPRAAEVDPENRLRWRFDVRRLQAEEIRDALLFTGGLLDPAMGGPALSLKNREYVFDHTSKDNTKYDSRRRSLYLPVVRNHLYDVFQLFDFGDASLVEGNRPTTTVAPQALFMLNADLVMDAADALAGKALERKRLTPEQRVRVLYFEAYGRYATPEETARSLKLLSDLERTVPGEGEARERRAWGALAHTLVAANEFIFVR